MMRLTSFGCSFIFGTDLHDDGRNGPYATPSQFTWPALCAQKLGFEYQCRARPGSGNLQILDRLLREAAHSPPAVFIIGWSWIDRFDYEETDSRKPHNEWQTICPISNSAEAKHYYRLLHSEFRDKISTLSCIKTAVDTLTQRGIPFVMTYMDSLMLDRKRHAPASVQLLQDYVEPHLRLFNGKTFLDWSRAQGFEISPTLHPLEPAHAQAAELMLPQIQRVVGTQSTNDR